MGWGRGRSRGRGGGRAHHGEVLKHVLEVVVLSEKRTTIQRDKGARACAVSRPPPETPVPR